MQTRPCLSSAKQQESIPAHRSTSRGPTAQSKRPSFDQRWEPSDPRGRPCDDATITMANGQVGKLVAVHSTTPKELLALQNFPLVLEGMRLRASVLEAESARNDMDRIWEPILVDIQNIAWYWENPVQQIRRWATGTEIREVFEKMRAISRPVIGLSDEERRALRRQRPEPRTPTNQQLAGPSKPMRPQKRQLSQRHEEETPTKKQRHWRQLSQETWRRNTNQEAETLKARGGRKHQFVWQND